MAKDHNIAMQILENKYGGNGPFKGWFKKEPRLEKCKQKGECLVMGFRLPLKAMKVF
jgi:hypothetical protein